MNKRRCNGVSMDLEVVLGMSLEEKIKEKKIRKARKKRKINKKGKNKREKKLKK